MATNGTPRGVRGEIAEIAEIAAIARQPGPVAVIGKAGPSCDLAVSPSSVFLRVLCG